MHLKGGNLKEVNPEIYFFFINTIGGLESVHNLHKTEYTPEVKVMLPAF